MVKNIDWIVDYMVAKYRYLEPQSTKDIICNFCRVCKHELLTGNRIRISKIGAFKIKQKSEKKSRDFRGKPRIIPRMRVPAFISASTFRDFINEDR